MEKKVMLLMTSGFLSEQSGKRNTPA